MKKVLMFLDYYGFGGIEKVIQDIKENISNEKFQIEILSLVNSTHDLSIVSLLNSKETNFFKRNLKGLKKFSCYLQENSYDIIHIHCYNSFGLIYATIARKYVKKVIIHAHSSNICNDFFKIKWLINFLIKNIFSSKNFVLLAPTLECSKFCFGDSRVILIPNSICYSKYYFDFNERLKYRKLLNIKDKEVVIGHIGRFNAEKNHTFILDIFKEIVKLNGNYKLILVGEGKTLNKIKKKVKKINLEEKVLFLGNRMDISNLINVFDIYLFPSKFEGFPLTLVEAQVNGKYIFCSSKISKNVVISNRIFFLSLSENPLQWALKIMNHKSLKLILESRLDIHYYIEKIKKLYENL